jgi:hypothetical protein
VCGFRRWDSGVAGVAVSVNIIVCMCACVCVRARAGYGGHVDGACHVRTIRGGLPITPPSFLKRRRPDAVHH